MYNITAPKASNSAPTTELCPKNMADFSNGIIFVAPQHFITIFYFNSSNPPERDLNAT